MRYSQYLFVLVVIIVIIISGCLLEDPKELTKAHNALEKEKETLQTGLVKIENDLEKCKAQTERLSPVPEEEEE